MGSGPWAFIRGGRSGTRTANYRMSDHSLQIELERNRYNDRNGLNWNNFLDLYKNQVSHLHLLDVIKISLQLPTNSSMD